VSILSIINELIAISSKIANRKKKNMKHTENFVNPRKKITEILGKAKKRGLESSFVSHFAGFVNPRKKIDTLCEKSPAVGFLLVVVMPVLLAYYLFKNLSLIAGLACVGGLCILIASVVSPKAEKRVHDWVFGKILSIWSHLFGKKPEETPETVE